MTLALKLTLFTFLEVTSCFWLPSILAECEWETWSLLTEKALREFLEYVGNLWPLSNLLVVACSKR